MMEYSMAATTITGWYQKCGGVCPTCGVDMNKFHPEANIYQHYTGSCKESHEPTAKLNPTEKPQ